MGEVRTDWNNMSGSLTDNVEWKDVALNYVSLLGMDGATYNAIEFIGSRHLMSRLRVD